MAVPSSRTADLEIHHRLFDDGIVQGDRHLGQRFAGKGHQTDPVGGSPANESDRLPLGHLEPVGGRKVLRQHAAGDVDRDDDRDAFLLDLDRIAADPRARGGEAQRRQ